MEAENAFSCWHGMDFDTAYAVLVKKLRNAGCVFAEEEAQLLLSAAKTPSELAAMAKQRMAGLPLQLVVGWAEFCGLRIEVDPGVFIPRKRTEFLVRQAAIHAPSRAVVLDLCCGTGALGVALAANLDHIELISADIDPVAVRCARRNVAAYGGTVFEGDLYEPLPLTLQGRVDILVANAPYVPTDAIRLLPPEARLHESRIALNGGEDGLDIQRRIAHSAPLWLTPGGRLLMETSESQADRACEIYRQYGLLPQIAHSDEWEATVVIGIKSSD